MIKKLPLMIELLKNLAQSRILFTKEIRNVFFRLIINTSVFMNIVLKDVPTP